MPAGLRARLPVLLAIAVALIVGLAVRVEGLRHGSPNLVFHPDVPKQLWVAIKYERGNLDLREMYDDDIQLTHYPYGTAILGTHVARVLAPLTGAELRALNLWSWAFHLRLLSTSFALLGALAVLLGFGLRWGFLPTLVAGLLILLEPVNAHFSHYAMNDVPLVGLLLVAWVLSTRMTHDKAALPWRALLVGVLLGLAFGVKYQALLAGVFPCATWLQSLRKGAPGWTVASLLACIAGALAGVFLTSPLLVEDPAFFLAKFPAFMAWQANITGAEMPFVEKAIRNLRHLISLFIDGGRFLLLVPAGWAVGSLWRGTGGEDQRLALGSSLSFCFLLVVSMVVSRDYVRAADLMPAMIFFSAITGFMLTQLAASASPRCHAAAAVGAMVLIASFGATSTLDARALARTDTRVLARDWCRQNIPAGSVVRRELHTLLIDRPEIVEKDYRSFTDPGVKRVIMEGHYDYLVLNSLASQRFDDPHLPYSGSDAGDFMRELKSNNEIVAEFSDRPVFFSQPTITILKKRAGAADAP